MEHYGGRMATAAARLGCFFSLSPQKCTKVLILTCTWAVDLELQNLQYLRLVARRFLLSMYLISIYFWSVLPNLTLPTGRIDMLKVLKFYAYH